MDFETGVNFVKLLSSIADRIVDSSKCRSGGIVTSAIKNLVNKIIPEGLLFRGFKVIDDNSVLPESIKLTGAFFVVSYKISHTSLSKDHFFQASKQAGDLGLGEQSIDIARGLELSVYNTYSFEVVDGEVVSLHFSDGKVTKKVPYDKSGQFRDNSYMVMVVPAWL